MKSLKLQMQFALQVFLTDTFYSLSYLCLAVQCQAPIFGVGSAPLEKEIYLYNEKVEFKCKEGYTLVGDAEAICQSDGTFSPTLFICALGQSSIINFVHHTK